MDELKQHKRWVEYKLVPKENGKFTKIPCDNYGIAIKAQLPENWRSWSYIQSKQRKGFVLAGDGIACIDLDNCLVKPKDEQKKLYKVFSNSWIEKSVSGNGLHLWFKTDYTGHAINHDLGIELYTNGRFIALGIPVNNNPLQFVQATELEKILNRLGLVQQREKNSIKPVATSGSDSTIDCAGVTDEDCKKLLEKVVNGKYGSAHRRRINGDLTVDGGDWSKSVMFLLSAFAYHSGNNVLLMWKTILTCKKLLKLRSEQRYMHNINNMPWLVDQVYQAVSYNEGK